MTFIAELRTHVSAEVILYAPNVHTGGGVVLLNLLLAAWPAGKPLRAFLDIRAIKLLNPIEFMHVTWVSPSIFGRLQADLLAREAANREGVVLLCFHGLPPLFSLRGDAVIFIQNRLLIERGSLAAYPIRVRSRIRIERLWCRVLQHRCNRYIVQTPSMAASLKQWLRPETSIAIVPFISSPSSRFHANRQLLEPKFDFVYVASGEPHKNHRTLLESWRLLAMEGFTPSLALTVNPDLYPNLCAEIDRNVTEGKLKIVNLGQVLATDIDTLYKSSGALVFPSKLESLGLPLIEASRLGLPILAPELDYVRDVVRPVETFDPESHISIARAVRRFLKDPSPLAQMFTAKEFLAEVFK